MRHLEACSFKAIIAAYRQQPQAKQETFKQGALALSVLSRQGGPGTCLDASDFTTWPLHACSMRESCKHGSMPAAGLPTHDAPCPLAASLPLGAVSMTPREETRLPLEPTGTADIIQFYNQVCPCMD